MEYRTLGATGLRVSTISLGTEYLIDRPAGHAPRVIRAAIDAGINYFDLFWPQPEFRTTMGESFRGLRDKVHLAAHLGAAQIKDQYTVVRDPKTSEEFFNDFLERYETDYVDVLFLHNCDKQKDYDRLMGPGGLGELVQKYKEQGKTRAIGFSGHTPETSLQAVQSGFVDVLMYPVNPMGSATDGRDRLFTECVRRNIGIVAMKPFGGGRLLAPRKSAAMKIQYTGAGRQNIDRQAVLSPLQGLHYALSTIGVSTVVPGCSNTDELETDLCYFDASEAEKDYSAVIGVIGAVAAGECVYCNHCLPCPVRIDIGAVIRLYETALRYESPSEARSAYRQLAVAADACTSCGACEKRCPFDVSTVEKIRLAAEYFSA